MLCALLVLATPFVTLAPPAVWSRDLAAPPRLPLVGDVDNDGYADLLAMYPPGASIIDVSLNVSGLKPGYPFQGLTDWGKDCQAAVCGPFDTTPGDDVAGVFDGRVVRLAGSFASGRFKDLGVVVELPRPLDRPEVASVLGGTVLLVFSTTSGEGYQVHLATKKVDRFRVPKSTVWIGELSDTFVGQDAKGTVFLFDRDTWKRSRNLGAHDPDSRPVSIGAQVVTDHAVLNLTGSTPLATGSLPTAASRLLAGDMDKDGDADIVEFRYGTERHSRYQILVRRTVSPGETDSDADGLTNDDEAGRGTDPLMADSDNDSLLDGWEVNGFRGLDLPAMGCSPLHTDVVCFVSRFETVPEDKCKADLDRAVDTYGKLPTPNPDGKNGFNVHLIHLDPVKGDDMKRAWWQNRDAFLPAKWRGLAHWMQVTPGGGGQADQLGDGGTVGQNALWAVFLHEFGHQLGADHEGFWPNSLCPIYTSLMNYAYSYSLNDDYNKIAYSDGRLAGFVLRETDLDETLPLPFDKVSFLEKGPYRFRLKANGDTTLIDWNWNGVFGEKHVRADINYSYSTNAGRRDDVGKSHTSPWLFVHQGRAHVVFGAWDGAKDKTQDPTLGPGRPGRLVLRRLTKPFEWEPPVTLEAGGLTGDPVAASYRGQVWLVYPTAQGVVARSLQTGPKGSTTSLPVTLDANASLVPSVAVHDGRLFVFLTDPADGSVQYRCQDKAGTFSRPLYLDGPSENPVGACTDTKTGDLIVALARSQGSRSNRWAVQRYRHEGGRLKPLSLEWVEGEKGNARGSGRLTVLFDPGRDNGPDGRIYVYGRGLTSAQSPWACTYVAHQIVDKTVNGGWMVKRYYDEWTQSRSAPAAAWYQGDVIWAYRWVDGGQGETDNNLHVGYSGLGIQSQPMGDHDDLTFFRTWGIRNSIPFLNRD